jgi:hypothetical protein
MIAFFIILALLLTVSILSIIRLYRFWNYMRDHLLTYDAHEDI